MNGLLNIQVRVLSREAQALLKQLEKEIAAVDKATNGQSTASKRLAIAQENARNQTRALTAATRELAAAQRASAAATGAIASANTKIEASELAYRKSLMATTQAIARRDALLADAPKAAAAAAAAAEKLARAEEMVTKAGLDEISMQKKLDIANRNAAAAKGQNATLNDLVTIAENNLSKARIAGEAALRASYAAEAESAASKAKLIAAQEALAAAQLQVDKAMLDGAVAAERVTAAHAALAAAENELAAAEQRVVAAEGELTASHERVAIASAAATKAAQANAASVAAGGAAAGVAAAGGFAKATSAFTNFANRAQWAGRQLQTNFTMPIAIAGGFAIKFALDNEKAFVKLSKVYGDDPTKDYSATLNKLKVTMRLLSEQFGVQQKDVLEIGAAWAAAGAQGESLARGTQLTLRTMVVGEMDAAEATKALISIQAQWGESTKDLAATFDMLNTVENQSAVNLKDLVDAYARASGSAKNAGVTQEQLAVDIAALVPAAGSAAAAGNGLKTIYSKLIAPTQDAVDVMHLLGIETNKASWNNLTASDRLVRLADAYKGATQGQRDQADAVIFGRYQLNRASVLLDAIAKKEGDRAKLLKLIQDRTYNAATADKELQQVMQSNPQKLKQLGVIMQNVAADLGTQLVPALLAVASVLASVFRAFNRLDPSVRKLIAGMLVFMFVIGPIIRWVSALGVLFGWLGTITRGLFMAFAWFGKGIWKMLIYPFQLVGKAVMMAGRFVMSGMTGMVATVRTGLMMAGRFLLGWPGLILAAIVAVVALFHKQIADVFNGAKQTFGKQVKFFSDIADAIVGAFHKLPKGVQSAMMAVVNTVAAAAKAVYSLFSYLNPFAHHSPSLVENVKNGMAVVAKEFGALPSTVGVPIAKAYADIAAFKNATKDLMAGFDKLSQKKDYQDLLKVDPDGAAAYKVLAADLASLTPKLDALEKKQRAQQQVVDGWRAKVDAANNALEAQQKILDKLKDAADVWSTKLEAAKQRIQDLSTTPIKGMKAMEDQIFANEQAQKALQLQMLQMEDAVGPIDDLQNRMASLAGEIEKVRGEQSDLRSAGAGSDILSTYDAQIGALEQQQNAIGDTASQYNDLKKQLDDLQHAGQELDLQKSLNFDGLQRDIEAAANTVKEMSFDDIISGIHEAQTQADYYQGKLDDANKAVDKQQKIVDSLTASRDALQASLDAEQKKLDGITDSYQKMRDVVDDIKQAMSDISSISSQVKRGKNGDLSPAEQNFMDAGTGDFPIQGGDASLKTGEGDLDKFNKDLADKMKGLTDSLDMFGPIKKQWARFKGWWNSTVVAEFQGLFKQLVPGTDNMGMFGSKARYEDTPFWASIKEIPQRVSDIFNSPEMQKTIEVVSKIVNGALAIIRLFIPDLVDLYHIIVNNVVKAFKTWWPEIKKLWEPLKQLMILLWPLIAVIGGALLAALKVAAEIFNQVFGRALDFVIDLVGDLLRILAGMIEFIVGVLTGNWKMAWQGIMDIVGGAFEGIWHVIEGFVSIIWGVVWGFVKGIYDFFVWLWDELVGHSIIPDMCNAIVDWFVKLPGRILAALAALGQKLVDLIVAAWGAFQSALASAWTGTYNFIKGLPRKIYDGFMAGVDIITSIGSNIINWIKNGLTGAWSAVSSWVGDKITWVVSKFGGIKDALAGKFSGMFDGIKEAFRSAINFVINGWNSLSFKIPGFDPPGPGPKIGGFTLGVPHINPLAKGGIARGGQMHLVGEVGPELFIPGQTGRVLTNRHMNELMALANGEALSALTGAGAASAYRSAAPGQYAAMAAMADRRVSMASGGAAPLQSTVVNNNTEYHFHGDLSFPNIQSGEDAEAFLTNLSDLAG